MEIKGICGPVQASITRRSEERREGGRQELVYLSAPEWNTTPALQSKENHFFCMTLIRAKNTEGI